MRSRMLIVVYNNILDTAVRELLTEMEICGFTEVEGAKGKGCRTGYHLGTPVYPDLNNMLFVIENDEKINALAERLKVMKDEYPEEGLKIFAVPVEEV